MKGLEIPLRQGDLLIALNGFSGTLLGRQAHKSSHGHTFDGSRLGKELLICSAELEIQALIDSHEFTANRVT